MRSLLVLLFMLFTPLAYALNLVATTASMGMLAREVGGAAVEVSVLAPPDRDPHKLQAKPSMMRALRDADLVVAVGAELEAGWLPAAIQGAANPQILPGREGYFEAAAQVPLLDSGQAADRARGDVHPMGNPHMHLDPKRMATIAYALASRLARLVPEKAAQFQANAEHFAREVEARTPAWRQAAVNLPGAVLYHKNGDYLFAFLGLPVLGYIEPLPGVPPTAQHLKALVDGLQGQRGVVLYHAFQPDQGPHRVSESLGWPMRVVPLEPAVTAGAEDYFRLIDAWLEALAAGRGA